MEKKNIKNKAASKKAVKNKRQPQVFGSKSNEENEFKIVKELDSFIVGDVVYLTNELEKIFKEKGLI